MKRITVSIDEQTHRQARIRAAELGISLSALVRVSLDRLVAEPLGSTTEDGHKYLTSSKNRGTLRELLQEWDAKGIGLKISENLTREELYDRNALR